LKNLQNVLLFIGLIALLVYNIWDKLEEGKRLNIAYQAGIELTNITLPDSIDFCEEHVPLKEPDIREKLDEELHRNIDGKFGVQILMKRANRWYPKIEPILESYGIPDDFKYLVAIESAISNKESPVGAVGFWQFMELTGKEFGLEINEEIDERYDPLKSTVAACKFFKQAYERLNNWTLVAAAYNRGMSGIERELKKQKASSYYDLYLNKETSEYVYKIIAFKEVYVRPEKYNLTLKKRNLYLLEKIDYIEVTENVSDLVEFATQRGISYKQLKMSNPWLVGNSLTIEGKDKKYFIALPQSVSEDNPLKIDTEINEILSDSIAD